MTKKKSGSVAQAFRPPRTFSTRNQRFVVLTIDVVRVAPTDKGQRPFDRKNKVLTVAWNWDECGVLSVQERNGAYYVVDGQHRLARLTKEFPPTTEIVCEVVASEGTDRAAAAHFVNKNKVRASIRSVDEYLNRVTSEDPRALRCERVLRTHGLRVARSAGEKNILAVQAVLFADKLGVLDQVLQVAKPWREATGEAVAYQQTLLRALATYLKANPSCDIPRLIMRLQRKGNTPTQVERRLCNMTGGGTRLPEAAHVVFDHVTGVRRRAA